MLAVLTGDLIGSTTLARGRLADAMAALAAAADRIAVWQEAPVHFTRARGDGWQLVLACPAVSLRATMFLRASLRAQGRDLATRIAVAVADNPLPAEGDLNRAEGAAFTLSGRALDMLTAGYELSYRNASGNDGAARAAFILADRVSSGWTEAEARAVAPMLEPAAPTQAALAALLGITQQSVRDAVRRADLGSVLAAIQAWDE